MSGIALFRCCEHCDPACVLADEHLFPCYEDEFDDAEGPCEQGKQLAEATS